MKSKEAFNGEIRQILEKDNVVIFPKVNKCLKNVRADKETTCLPKRTLPTISFLSIPYDVGILMTFQLTAIHIVPLYD